ncbi:MAG TPA: EamA family transporter [Gemmatimonadaceae bacterium]|nr:EamA family transporter [Gemmatimonadaceae bacterium]
MKRASPKRKNTLTRNEKDSGASRSKIIAAYAAIYTVWGSTYLFIRFTIETIPPFLMGGTRFMLAGAALYLWSRTRSGEKPARRHWLTAVIVGACLVLGGNGAVVWSEQFVPSGMAALLVAILPFWMALIDWIRPKGTKPGAAVTIGLILGLIGLVVLIGPSALHPSAQSAEAARAGNGVVLKGAIILMLGSLSWAAGSIYSLHNPLPKSAFLATGMEMLAGGALLLVASLVRGELSHFNPADVSAKSLAGFVYLTTVGSLVGFTAYIWLLGHQPPSRVSTYAYVNPVVAVFLGWAFAGEPLSVRTAIAAAIIIGAVALITTARSGSQPERA